jgi:hypothetical protein
MCAQLGRCLQQASCYKGAAWCYGWCGKALCCAGMCLDASPCLRAGGYNQYIGLGLSLGVLRFVLPECSGGGSVKVREALLHDNTCAVAVLMHYYIAT